MKVIAGCIIKRGNKILMVKEAKKLCYGQWNYKIPTIMFINRNKRKEDISRSRKLKIYGYQPLLKGNKEVHENVGYIIDDGENRL